MALRHGTSEEVAMRYGVDPGTVMDILRGEVAVHPAHQLVAPGRVRSDVMSLIYQQSRTGALEPAEASAMLDALTRLRVRALNDRVSRERAWTIATGLVWEDTALAEYIAVAVLQADALVAGDARVRQGAEGLVALAPREALALG